MVGRESDRSGLATRLAVALRFPQLRRIPVLVQQPSGCRHALARLLKGSFMTAGGGGVVTVPIDDGGFSALIEEWQDRDPF